MKHHLHPRTPNPGLRYHHRVDHGPPEHHTADLVIYGATACGVAAAVQAARSGRKVILLAYGRHLGGMTSGGLGATDIGHKAAIGGLSREYYRRLGAHYGRDESWTFEPHVAEATFHDLLRETDVAVHFEQRLASVAMDGPRIRALTVEGGSSHTAGQFIDASYEGDLMAKAGVSFAVGREPNAQYHETLNGRHFGHPGHNFRRWVDPYIHPGDPTSGLLPGIQDQAPGFQGQGDRYVQAYNFRVCLTDDPANKRTFNGLPFPKPAGYDPHRYELLIRYIEAGVFDALNLTRWMPNNKTDTNNFGAFSSDNIGMQWDWPEADGATRERLFQDHVTYNQGMYHFLATDKRVPPAVRDQVMQFGLPADEFPETDGWPHELYVREARRMVSDLVITEHHCTFDRICEQPVAMAAYQMDSHNCRRLAIDGRAINEGNVEVKPTRPYGIDYRAIVPRRAQCENLVVPWCLSASHIAFGSIRMEPVGMILGQSAAVIADMALESRRPVQDLDYDALRTELLSLGQVLELPEELEASPCNPANEPRTTTGSR